MRRKKDGFGEVPTALKGMEKGPILLLLLIEGTFKEEVDGMENRTEQGRGEDALIGFVAPFSCTIDIGCSGA